MKSAFECFQEAAKYESMAADSSHEESRRMLLDVAAQWRELGKMVQAVEKGVMACSVDLQPPEGERSTSHHSGHHEFTSIAGRRDDRSGARRRPRVTDGHPLRRARIVDRPSD